MDVFLLFLPPRDKIETFKNKLLRLLGLFLVAGTLLIALAGILLVAYDRYKDGQTSNVAFFYKADGTRL